MCRYGAEGENNIPQGMWARNWKSLIDQVRLPHKSIASLHSANQAIFVCVCLCVCLCPQAQSLGFNAFRIPFSNEMLRNYSVVHGVWWDINSDLIGLTPLECLDKIVEYCGQVGMHIILDRHSAHIDAFTGESYWFVPALPLSLSIYTLLIHVHVLLLAA